MKSVELVRWEHYPVRTLSTTSMAVAEGPTEALSEIITREWGSDARFVPEDGDFVPGRWQVGEVVGHKHPGQTIQIKVLVGKSEEEIRKEEEEKARRELKLQAIRENKRKFDEARNEFLESAAGKDFQPPPPVRRGESLAAGDFWSPVEIQPNQCLKSLRDLILNVPDPPKRFPIWKFKPSDDLAYQIQPKDSARLLFDCQVLEGGVTLECFKDELIREARYVRRMRFQILARPDGEWMLQPKGVSAHATHLKYRVLKELPEMYVDREVLFSLNCLVCGKGLTDAVSIARMIGPECYTKFGGKNDNSVGLFLAADAS